MGLGVNHSVFCNDCHQPICLLEPLSEALQNISCSSIQHNVPEGQGTHFIAKIE